MRGESLFFYFSHNSGRPYRSYRKPSKDISIHRKPEGFELDDRTFCHFLSLLKQRRNIQENFMPVKKSIFLIRLIGILFVLSLPLAGPFQQVGPDDIAKKYPEIAGVYNFQPGQGRILIQRDENKFSGIDRTSVFQL
jgi:hypothetical protein